MVTWSAWVDGGIITGKWVYKQNLTYRPKKIGVKYQSINPSQVKGNNYDVIKLLILLLAPDLILLASNRPRDKTEKMAAENRCAVRMGPKFTGHWPR